MEKQNDNSDAPDQDENVQNPESPETIILSSDSEDVEMDTDVVESTDAFPPDNEFSNTDVAKSMDCQPSTSSFSVSDKKLLNEVSFQVKKEIREETSKTEVSSGANHLDVNKAPMYLTEVERRLKTFQQETSAASTTDISNESSVSLPNDSQDLLEAMSMKQQPSPCSTAASSADASVSNSTTATAPNHSSVPLPNIQSNASQDLLEAMSMEQQPSPCSTAASSADASVSNSTTATAPNHSSVPLPSIQSNASQDFPIVLLRNCDHDAMEMGAKVWREEAVPRVLLRNCDRDAIEMGAEVWREERIVWAAFGKSNSFWPGITFNEYDIKQVKKPQHKFVLWFGSYNYSQVRKEKVLDFRQHFEEKFIKVNTKKKAAVLEALKLLAAMSNISENTDLLDWAMSRFPGFQYRDEVLIEFLRPYLEKLK